MLRDTTFTSCHLVTLSDCALCKVQLLKRLLAFLAPLPIRALFSATHRRLWRSISPRAGPAVANLQTGSRYLELSVTPTKGREKREDRISTIKIKISAANRRADPAPPAPRRDSSRPMMGAYRTPLLSLHAARACFPLPPHTRDEARHSG